MIDRSSEDIPSIDDLFEDATTTEEKKSVVPAPSRGIQNQLPTEEIQAICEKVKSVIDAGRIRPPRMTDLNNKQYKKIKNFIHNICKKRLCKDDIDIVVAYIN